MLTLHSIPLLLSILGFSVISQDFNAIIVNAGLVCEVTMNILSSDDFPLSPIYGPLVECLSWTLETKLNCNQTYTIDYYKFGHTLICR